MTHFNYFAESEQAGQARFQQQRDGLLGPLVRLLIACRISADMVSFLSILQLIPCGIFLLRAPANQPEQHLNALWAFGFLLLHVLLDALDGPIARRTGTAGPAGSFTDMSVDHSGMLITTALLTAAGFIDGTVGVAYAASYTVAIVFIVWLNMLGRPLRFVIRTKYLLYGLVLLYGGLGWNWISPAVYGFTAIHLTFALIGWFRVRSILKEEQRTMKHDETESPAQ